jgi:electron transport complex protein RnfB
MADASAIDALLPQTQCTKCGYSGCRPYADAMASGVADINQCPPGGEAGVAKLARALGREAKPLNPANGAYRAPQVAVIDEAICIGCTKCIQACPVDAIVGASQLMHTVIADWCTGCELCIPPCPVDCIALVAVATLPEPTLSRRRFEFRNFRLARGERERAEKLAAYE